MLNFLIKIILNPPKWLTKLLLSFFVYLKEYPKRAVIDLMSVSAFLIIFSSLIYYRMNYSYDKIKYIHENIFIIKSLLDKEITYKMKDVAKSMGKGSTIIRVSIGFEKKHFVKPSISYDYVYSCVPYQKNCLVDSIFLNPKRYYKKLLSLKDLSNLNKDIIQLYLEKTYEVNSHDFSQNSPLCFSVYGDNKKESIQFITMKQQFPVLSSEIIRISEELDSETEEKFDNQIKNICLSKIKHPTKNNVIFLFIFSFWSYNNIYPQKDYFDSSKSFLKDLGNLQINNLLEINDVK